MPTTHVLTRLLDLSHADERDPEALELAAAQVIDALVAQGLLNQAEAADAYFEECVDRTANLRVPAWGDEGWLQWTEGTDPVQI